MSDLSLKDIHIRTELRPGDLGYIIYLHSSIYQEEYNYGIAFESYVAAGIHEFYQHYDPAKDRIWICEYNNIITGCLLLIHRPDNAAQLRYFLISKPYRGIGLGNKLMNLYMEFYQACQYSSSYLWTTNELDAAAGLYKRNGFRLTEEKESMAFGKKVMEQKYELVSAR